MTRAICFFADHPVGVVASGFVVLLAGVVLRVHAADYDCLPDDPSLPSTCGVAGDLLRGPWGAR